MQVGGRSGLVAVLVTASLGLAAAAAPAASGAGLEYVLSKEKSLPAGKVASARAKCPNDTKVTGGGVTVLGGNTATGIRSSFPIDDGDGDEKPDDGWLGTVVSRSAGNKKIAVVAICSRTGHFSYVVDQGLMGPDQTSSLAECPTGEPLAGGGVGLYTSKGAANEGLVAAAMLPSEGGFFAVGNNQTDALGLMEVFAICANSGSYEYVEREDTAPDGTQFGVAAPCPNGTKVTSGGVYPDSTSTSVEVARVFPYKDGGRLPDDGWQGTINNNNTGGPVDFSTWAVCRD